MIQSIQSQHIQQQQQIQSSETEVKKRYIHNNKLFKRDFGCTYEQFNNLFNMCMPLFSVITS